MRFAARPIPLRAWEAEGGVERALCAHGNGELSGGGGGELREDNSVVARSAERDEACGRGAEEGGVGLLKAQGQL